MNAIVVYAMLWLSFGFVHSLLTIASVKRRLEPLLGSAYRLSYNVFALFHIGLVFLLGRSLLGSNRLTYFSAWPVVAILTAVTLAGFLLMLLALRQYDLGQFSGLSQLRSAQSNQVGSDNLDNGGVKLEPLNVTGFNRWVRHPLYSGVFLFLWGSAVSPFGYWTALFASVYLVIGAHYEERKLIHVYGNDYRDYKANVPAFFPRISGA